MSILLFFGGQAGGGGGGGGGGGQPPVTTTANLTFMDALGINPLPAAQLVTLTRPGTATQSAYSGVGGTASFALSNSTIYSPAFASASATGSNVATISWTAAPPLGAIVIFAVTSGSATPTVPNALTALDQIAIPSVGRYMNTYWWQANGVNNSFAFSDTTDTEVVAAYVVGWGPVNNSNVDKHSITYVSGVTSEFFSPPVLPTSSYGAALSFFTYPTSGGTFADGGGFTTGGTAAGTVETLVGNFGSYGANPISVQDFGSISGVTSYAATTITIAPLATQYTASFYGTWSPSITMQVANTQADQTLNIPTYQSPTLSQTGTTQAQSGRWVRGAFGSTSRQQRGVAYNLAWGLAWSLNQLSIQLQTIMQASRLPTSVSTQIDTWAQDFFGNNLPRLIGESDAKYISRIQTVLASPGSLTSGISGVASLYGSVTLTEPWRGDLVGGIDHPTVACDGTYGCVAQQSPRLSVYITPTVAFTQTTGAQAASLVMTKKPAGINMSVYGVSTQSEGYGLGRYGEARYGLSTERIATLL